MHSPNFETQSVFTVREFFIPKEQNPIHPSRYRLNFHRDKCEVHQENLVFKKNVVGDFRVLSKEEKKALSTTFLLRKLYFEKYHATEDIFYGKFPLLVFKDKWTHLPSLSFRDNILFLSASEPEAAFQEVRDFTEAADYAKKRNLKPIPTPRDFIARLALFSPAMQEEQGQRSDSEKHLQGKKLKVMP